MGNSPGMGRNHRDRTPIRQQRGYPPSAPHQMRHRNRCSPHHPCQCGGKTRRQPGAGDLNLCGRDFNRGPPEADNHSSLTSLAQQGSSSTKPHIISSTCMGVTLPSSRAHALDHFHAVDSLTKPLRTGLSSMYRVARRINSRVNRLRSNPPPRCQRRCTLPVGVCTSSRLSSSGSRVRLAASSSLEVRFRPVDGMWQRLTGSIIPSDLAAAVATEREKMRVSRFVEARPPVTHLVPPPADRD
jgi:hypothetical protein